MTNETAVLGGGCFWCVEAVFKMLRGVTTVESGYAGGRAEEAKYDVVSSGASRHVEVVRITFDPAHIGYQDLLTVFFGSHDPTTLNRQGNDVGTQYRSVIFFTTPEQQTAAETFIRQINDSTPHGKTIVTTVEPLECFYPAEDYHRDYYSTHADAPYCQLVINPKLAKIGQQFSALLNKHESRT
ncbi:MAG: peptide-methionine (S)-S-oxide reductase MsrA [Patescibacteria group bacterium]